MSFYPTPIPIFSYWALLMDDGVKLGLKIWSKVERETPIQGEPVLPLATSHAPWPLATPPALP